uniref:Uncharacterized protein n=1 Tax=Cacopsylla melanoneura TaxID=428564 RepID=A0A8D9DXG0_9HEMI
MALPFTLSLFFRFCSLQFPLFFSCLLLACLFVSTYPRYYSFVSIRYVLVFNFNSCKSICSLFMSPIIQSILDKVCDIITSIVSSLHPLSLSLSSKQSVIVNLLMVFWLSLGFFLFFLQTPGISCVCNVQYILIQHVLCYKILGSYYTT